MGKKKKQVSNNVLRRILLIVCGAILGVNIYYLNSVNLVGEQLPMPFGYGAAVVLSGSMEPEFSQGDLIAVKETGAYEEGDIVVFQQTGVLIVHRIIEVDKDTVTTKGDANPVADAPIGKDAIKGEVMFSIPFVGVLVDILKTPIGTVCIIAAAILLIEIPRRREKQRDDEEKQKIIEEIIRLKNEK